MYYVFVVALPLNFIIQLRFPRNVYICMLDNLAAYSTSASISTHLHIFFWTHAKVVLVLLCDLIFLLVYISLCAFKFVRIVIYQQSFQTIPLLIYQTFPFFIYSSTFCLFLLLSYPFHVFLIRCFFAFSYQTFIVCFIQQRIST